MQQTRNTSRRPYAAETVNWRDPAKSIYPDRGNHFNGAKLREDEPRDFRKVLPHQTYDRLQQFGE